MVLPRKFIADEVHGQEIAVAGTRTNFGPGAFQELLGELRPTQAELTAVLDGDAAQVGARLLLLARLVGCGVAGCQREDQQGG